MKIQKGLVQVLLHDHSSVHGVQVFTSLVLGQLLHTLEEDTATAPVLYLQETNSQNKWPAFSRATVPWWKWMLREQLRVGGLQMQVDHTFHAGLHLGGIILTNLGAHG